MTNLSSAMLAAMMRADPGQQVDQEGDNGMEDEKLPSNSYVQQGSFIDWLQSLLPNAVSGRKAAIKDLNRLQEIDKISRGY